MSRETATAASALLNSVSSVSHLAMAKLQAVAVAARLPSNGDLAFGRCPITLWAAAGGCGRL